MNKIKTQTYEEFAKKLTKKEHVAKLMCDENGKCNGCNGCCGLLTQITLAELKILRREFKNKHLLQYINNQKAVNYEALNGMCFFFINGKCDIYSLRPQVCRDYHCDPRFNKPHKHTEAKFIFELLPSELQKPFIDIIRMAIKGE